MPITDLKGRSSQKIYFYAKVKEYAFSQVDKDSEEILITISYSRNETLGDRTEEEVIKVSVASLSDERLFRKINDPPKILIVFVLLVFFIVGCFCFLIWKVIMPRVFKDSTQYMTKNKKVV